MLYLQEGSPYKYLMVILIVVAAIFIIINIGTKAYVFATRNQSNPPEKEAFTDIYKRDLWGGGSGPGSKPENALAYMTMLRGVLLNDSIKTIADLGCGDWVLMEKIKVPNDKIYTGFDLVESVIDKNISKHAAKNISFVKINDINDFVNVKADLLIVKDVLQHWPDEQIQFFLEKILPNFKYALITNDYAKDNSKLKIKHGGFRDLNLQAKPFNKATDDINFKIFMDYPAHGKIKRVYLFESKKPYIFN